MLLVAYGGVSEDMNANAFRHDGEDKDLLLWQVLIHVDNQGTDHRAQLLNVPNDLGVKTTYQAYIFYVHANL
jgi:hypothetical protein